MSANLDKSLDEILVSARPANRGRGRGRRGGRAAPVGGVKKPVAKSATKPAVKGTNKAEPVTSNAPGATKVIVSGLPVDVDEKQVKEYFTQVAGPIRYVNLTYGPNGKSRGIATIVFNKGTSGAKALNSNGVTVDGRQVKVEAVYDAQHMPGQAPLSLADRIKPDPRAKVEPKQVKAAKPAEKATRGGAKGRGRGERGGRGTARGRNAGRGKPKTADELDAEMTDYFTAPGGDAPATNGAAPTGAAGGDDAGMDVIS